MKYFIDTEFIEGFHKPLFGKKRHYIDLISIGIVCEDGREYYAISNEFNPEVAAEWVKENVLYPIMLTNGYTKHLSNIHGCLSYNKQAIKSIQKHNGKSNKHIAEDIYEFCKPTPGRGNSVEGILEWNNPEFYGYYSDYDWVLFCSLFGRMMDLPKGFPMYCIDLKQTLEEKNEKISKKINAPYRNQDHAEYPKQTNEHNALSDAKWNKQLFEFLNKI